MDSIKVWTVLRNPEKFSGKKGMKLVQKNNEVPRDINKRKKNKIELESDLRNKNGEMKRMIVKVNMK